MLDRGQSGWIVERGIGEDRALKLVDGRVVGARCYRHGELFAGSIVDVQLTSKPAGARRGTATTQAGAEVLVDHLPPHLTEGARFPVTITRAPLRERDRVKPAQGRFSETPATSRSKWMAESSDVRAFTQGEWEEIWQAAFEGRAEFDGGALIFYVTPAMTLVDIDGDLPALDLCRRAVPALARWLALFDLGGSIGIDFPTLFTKADRKAVDAALETALSHWPHERTAMNGFGFVQIVARMEGPSLLHRMAGDRVGMAARFLLRSAERAEGAGRVLAMTCHPGLAGKLSEAWLAELQRRTGKEVRITADPHIAIGGGHAQIVADD